MERPLALALRRDVCHIDAGVERPLALWHLLRRGVHNDAGVDRPLLPALVAAPARLPTAAAAAAASAAVVDALLAKEPPLHGCAAEVGRLLRALEGPLSTSEAVVETWLKQECSRGARAGGACSWVKAVLQPAPLPGGWLSEGSVAS